MKALLTNAESAKTLACIRALGTKGIDVYVTGYYKHAPAFHSKYCKKHFVVHCPSEEDAFLKDMLSIIKNENIDVLVPINSEETILLSKHATEITKHCKFPFEKYERMMLLHDKGKLMKLAAKLKVPIPKTFFINKASDLRKVNFPCVVKVTRSKSSKGVFYAKDMNELKKALKQHEASDKIIQEYVNGETRGVSYLYHKGRMITYFAHKRLREYPVTGGPSSYRESINAPELVKIGKKILDYVRWDGLAMVEFKGGKLLEINPRFWGSVNQAIQAGVNFPYLLVQKAAGNKISLKPGNYAIGVRTKLYLNDVRSIISLIRARRYSLWRVFEIFDFRKCDELSFSDLAPFFYYVYYVARYKRKA